MSTQPSEAVIAPRGYAYRPISPTKRPQTYSPSQAACGRRGAGGSHEDPAAGAETPGVSRAFLKGLIREVLAELGINSLIEAQETRFLEMQRQLRQLTQTLTKVRDVLEANSDDILNLQGQIDNVRQAFEAFQEETKDALTALQASASQEKSSPDPTAVLSIQKEIADIRFELSTIKTVSRFF